MSKSFLTHLRYKVLGQCCYLSNVCTTKCISVLKRVGSSNSFNHGISVALESWFRLLHRLRLFIVLLFLSSKFLGRFDGLKWFLQNPRIFISERGVIYVPSLCFASHKGASTVYLKWIALVKRLTKDFEQSTR